MMKTFEQYNKEFNPSGLDFMDYINSKLDKDYFIFDGIDIIKLQLEEGKLSHASWFKYYFDRDSLLDYFGIELRNNKEGEYIKHLLTNIQNVIQNIDKEEYNLIMDSKELGLL